MNFEIVELDEFSGDKTSIYSVFVDDDECTLFDQFIEENKNQYKEEIKFILNRLQAINESTGAREQFFKINEGKPGDGVVALYDEPDSNLRLYCIRFGMVAVILGGGGFKSKNIAAWQEDEKLSKEVNKIMLISEQISVRIKERDIEFDSEGKLIGNLIFNDNEDE